MQLHMNANKIKILCMHRFVGLNPMPGNIRYYVSREWTLLMNCLEGSHVDVFSSLIYVSTCKRSFFYWVGLRLPTNLRTLN